MQKVIPPFLFLVTIVCMVILHFLVPVSVLIKQPFNYFGVILFMLGLIFAKTVRNIFNKVDIEIHTFKKPRQLVTSGLFEYTRNPIYLGFAISLTGLNIILGSLTPIVGVVSLNHFLLVIIQK